MNFRIKTPLYSPLSKKPNQTLNTWLEKLVGGKITRYDGHEVGDKFKILWPGGIEWIGIITQADETGFTDECTAPPFGLEYWKHQHIYQEDFYEDNVEFSSRYSDIFHALFLWPHYKLRGKLIQLYSIPEVKRVLDNREEYYQGIFDKYSDTSWKSFSLRFFK